MARRKRKTQSTFGLTCAALVVFAMACSSTRNKTEVKTTETTRTQQSVKPVMPAENEAVAPVARSADEKNVVSTIEFTPGQRNLSPEATAELNRAILEAKQRGEVEEINIAVWSDLKTADARARVPRSQVNIAKERGENIERYVDLMEPEVNVKVHNMATRPSGFADYLNTQDATTKRQLAEAGVATNNNEEVNGPSSSALVLIKVK